MFTRSLPIGTQRETALRGGQILAWSRLELFGELNTAQYEAVFEYIRKFDERDLYELYLRASQWERAKRF